jgi:hypothetical protein
MEKRIDPSNIDPRVERTSETSWIITLEEDPETGELIMPLPSELLESQGWHIGDTLVWDFNNVDKTATLKKKVE